MINRLEESLCTGCTACRAVCPKRCISMIKDEEGFNYPVIDTVNCINCNLCEQVCPLLNKLEVNKDTNAYAVINKDEEVRLNSTSGGFFSILANYILDKKGYVVGASYNDEYIVEHIIIDKKEDLHKLRCAKYSQSELSNIFNQVKVKLDVNQFVLFSGTPCQVGGLKSYLRKDYDNLITVDLICHGVPSPKVWKDYVEYRSKKDNNGVLPLNINLRSKITGWPRYSVLFDYGDKQYTSYSNEDLFVKAFVGDYCLRQSCSNCVFKGINRVSDFTLGDYWGIEGQLPNMHDNKGTSLIFVHSDKARKLINLFREDILVEEVNCEQSITFNPSMIRSSISKDCRKEFIKEINGDNFEEKVNQYCIVPQSTKSTLASKIKSKIKRILNEKGKL